MDEESEGTLGVLAAILLLFTAMLNPITSLILAAAGLVALIAYKMRGRHRPAG
jgi:4-hydroxybenzoate polyprenyltransferase